MISAQHFFSCLLLVMLMGLLVAGCAANEQASLVDGGNPTSGRQLIQRYGCHSCHRIPGVPGAHSYVGPPLIAWSERHFIAGNLENTPENLIDWIMHPQSIEPGSAMPDMNVSEQDAKDISAYLFTLEADE